jgi:microsomal dipeptidase-like Zn-dependent dipeptidase
VFAFIVVAWLGVGASQAFAECGGANERACCGITGEGAPCNSGLTEVNGCTGDCFCGTFLGIDVYANSSCVQASPCGGDGERGCCGGELINGVSSCDAGLIALSGCNTGDCLCGGSANPDKTESSTHCFKPSHCGGDGERACCAGTFEYADNTNALICETGEHPVFGCSGDCQCGGGTATEGVLSLQMCISMSECGKENERACCLSERANPCDDGLTSIPGCTGDCFCPNGTSSTTCIKLDGDGYLPKISQPGTNQATPPADSRVCALRGYADLHVHMFSDIAHGGGTLAGASWDSVNDDVNTALRPDYGTHRDLVSNTEADLPVPSCPPWIRDCGTNLFHGDHTLKDDPVGIGTGDGPESNLGAPNFTGWPTWHTTTHQQVYYKWLERAWQGGLRLMSMLAVTNEALCRGNYHERGVDCADSMTPIDKQLQLAKDFQTYIDTQSGGPGKGWFHIVYTPAEARQTIADGKLAVVLGIEVDNLFNCHWGNRNDTDPAGNCSPEGIVRNVNYYYDLGVRHVFPIHNFDNAYGGPATWQDAIDVGNRVSEGHWYSPMSPDNSTSGIVDCSADGYKFKLSCFMQSVIQLLGYPDSVLPLTDPVPCYNAAATCNTIGLTSRGATLVNALMDKGMIIDIDHMSVRALDDTLALAEARSPAYPVVATHVQFFDLNIESERHERMRTKAQLQRIAADGGMIAAMLKDDAQDGLGGKGKRSNIQYQNVEQGIGTLPDTCRHSSETFAQAYEYAVDVMGRPVAFGSDFNGIAGHVGPRFGPDGCGSILSEWIDEYHRGNRLQYPFDFGSLGEPGFGSFGKQVTGGKTFDYNVDGLAHIGLLPDMVADLRQVGMPQDYLDKMFGSAEEYIRVWERASGVANNTSITGSQPVAHCEARTVNADASCQGTADVAPVADQNNSSLTLTQNPAGPYGLGTTSVTLNVGSSLSCDTDSCQADVTVVDKTGPSVTCPAAPSPVECTGTSTTVSYGAAQATDNCGAATVDGCSPASGTGFASGSTKVTCSAHDAAQNSSSCDMTVQVVDTASPSVTCPTPLTVECTGSRSAVATFSAQASDVCAGTLTPSCPTSGNSFPLGTTSVSCSATDPSNNTGSCTSSVTVRDTTPPSISCPAPSTLECTGSNGAHATVTATGSDVCWGTLSPTCSNAGANAFYPLGTTSIQCSESDGSGLGAQCGTSVKVVDTTGPQVTSGVTTSMFNIPTGPNHNLLTVGFTASAVDTCNGSLPVTVKVYANEDDQTPTGDGTFSPDAASIAPGTLRLRYERVGSGNGRVYLIVTTATDSSGNTSASCATVTVPQSQTAASMATVTSMASAARAACVAGKGAMPAGYFVVGDGPIIGTKQ